MNPCGPSDPELPEDPDVPELPEDPFSPDVPADPEEPDVPVDPELPEDPEEPDVPAVPLVTTTFQFAVSVYGSGEKAGTPLVAKIYVIPWYVTISPFP